MNINTEELQSIAKLANIKIDNDLTEIHNKVLSIIKKINILQEVDTTCVKEFKHIHFQNPHTRQDTVDDKNNRDALAKLAANFNEEYYQVPLILTDTGK